MEKVIKKVLVSVVSATLLVAAMTPSSMEASQRRRKVGRKKTKAKTTKVVFSQKEIDTYAAEKASWIAQNPKRAVKIFTTNFTTKKVSSDEPRSVIISEGLKAFATVLQKSALKAGKKGRIDYKAAVNEFGDVIVNIISQNRKGIKDEQLAADAKKLFKKALKLGGPSNWMTEVYNEFDLYFDENYPKLSEVFNELLMRNGDYDDMSIRRKVLIRKKKKKEEDDGAETEDEESDSDSDSEDEAEGETTPHTS